MPPGHSGKGTVRHLTLTRPHLGKVGLGLHPEFLRRSEVLFKGAVEGRGRLQGSGE